MDGGHVHTDFIAFVYAGISAIIFIQILRLVSAKLIDAGHEGAGTTLGALVNFG